MINPFHLNKIQNKSIIGIYFLWDVDTIVYIGQSIDIDKRISEHRKNKKFSHYSYIECSKKDLNKLESSYIKTYNPILNTLLIDKHSISPIENRNLNLNTAIIENNILYINVNSIILNIQITNNLKFVGYKGYLKNNKFNNSYYGEIELFKFKYFIVYDEPTKIYEIKKI